MESLRKYVARVGRKAAAEAFHVSESMLGHWLTGRKPITPERARSMDAVTGGEVSRFDLIPGHFDPLPHDRISSAPPSHSEAA